MKLYFMPTACSLSPHIILRELGLEFQLERVTRAKKTKDGGDFLAINPKGYVPALELDSGEILTEGVAIVQYLADQKPESHLAPAAGTMERVRLQEWLTFIATELHKGFSPLFSPTLPDDVKSAARERVSERLTYMARHLSEKKFVLGDAFSVADAYLFTILNWGQFTGIDLGKWPVLAAYHATIAARPSVKAAMAAESAR